MSNATRTPQQALKDAIESGAVTAWIDGKKVQQRWIDDEVWMNGTADVLFTNTDAIWRPAPEPRWRPWKDGSEVPKLAIYRDDRWDNFEWSLIIGVSSEGIEISIGARIKVIGFAEASQTGKYSLDGGKTWAPCGVQEGGE